MGVLFFVFGDFFLPLFQKLLAVNRFLSLLLNVRKGKPKERYPGRTKITTDIEGVIKREINRGTTDEGETIIESRPLEIEMDDGRKYLIKLIGEFGLVKVHLIRLAKLHDGAITGVVVITNKDGSADNN